MEWLRHALSMAFTKENAATFSKLGHIARWTNRMPENSEPIATPAMASEVALPEDEFRNATMIRVRKHVAILQDKLDDALDEADYKARRDLAESLKKLEEVEQRLSNRPLPGTLKPTQAKPRRTPDFIPPTPAD